jgi:IS5 family transposase
MMRREADLSRQMSFADLSLARRLVPRDHELLQIHRAVDWAALEDQLLPYYAEGGRPTVPIRPVRMLIVQQYANLSDEEVEAQVGYNLLYREFVGLGLEERVPDATSLVALRERLGVAGVRALFDTLNVQWDAAGLLGKERRVFDGVHLWAKVGRRSWTSLLREAQEHLLDAVAAQDLARVEPLRTVLVAVPPPVVAADQDRELAHERARAAALLGALTATEAARWRDAVADVKNLMGDEDRLCSFHDRDARWGHKAADKPFLGYKAHESLDPDSRLITAVDVVAGNVHEGVRTDVLLEHESVPLNDNAIGLGDGLYNNATTTAQVKAAGLRPCFTGLNVERISDAFTYDVAVDRLTCRAGKHSIGKTRLKSTAGDLYYFSCKDCRPCPQAKDCLTRGEREGSAEPRRRVCLTDVRKAQIVAGEAGAQWRKEQLKVRSYIEPKFNEQMNDHGLRHARYWGVAKVTAQVLWNALTVNLKRAVRLLAARAKVTPAAPSHPEAA